jgi:hypothetical protein
MPQEFFALRTTHEYMDALKCVLEAAGYGAMAATTGGQCLRLLAHQSG